MRRFTILEATSLLALATLACGADPSDSAKPTARSMLPSGNATETATGAGNGTPVIERVALTPPNLVPGQDIQVVVEASDPDGDRLRFDYTWTYNGKPVQSGAKSIFHPVQLEKGDRVKVTVTATDGVHVSSPREASASAQNRPPVLSAVGLKPFGDVRAGEVITAAPMASDPDNDVLRYSYRWTVNGRARGRERSLDTTGLQRGDQVQVAVVAHDGTRDSREERSPVLMLGNSPPVITRLPTSRSEDGTFQYTFSARDPDGDRNLRFFLEKAPAGVRMDAITGVLTWTPMATQAGVHEIEVGVQDAAGEGTTFVFELSVQADAGGASSPAARGY